MKKQSQEINNKIKVKRLGTSTYFSDTFLIDEQNSINKIPEVSMISMDAKDEFEIAISNTAIKLTPESAKDYSQLKLIIHSNSGHDNIDIDFVKEKNIPIIIGNEIRAYAVANYILSVFIQHFNNIPKTLVWDKLRAFKRPDTRELNLLILGYGHVGKILTNTLDNIVNNITIYDPFKGFDKIPDILFDVVIPVASLNPTTFHFIDKKFLDKLSPQYVVINASRGEIIKTCDLIDSLRTHPNAFAYLDVYEKEPNDFSDFKDLSNIKLTSHIAGVYDSIEKDTIAFEIRVISDYLKLNESDFNKKYFAQNLLNKITRKENIKDFLI